MHGMMWSGQDVTGWEMTEKLDGLRVEVRGGRAYSKSGHHMRLPSHIEDAIKGMMDFDAELYSSPGCRAKLAGLTQSTRDDVKWPDGIALYAFDFSGPSPEKLPEGIRLVPHFGIAESNVAAIALARLVLIMGGEGIMCRAPKLKWTSKRTDRLLKIKKGNIV